MAQGAVMDEGRTAVLAALSGVVDPEVGLDIVTMGLVYGVEVTEKELHVTFTLTSPGCPLGETIQAMAEQALADVAAERAVTLELVWQPPWEPGMISAEGRRALRL